MLVLKPKKSNRLAVLLTASVLYSPHALAQDLSVSVSVDTPSEYVFRGVTLAGSAIQPGVELSYGGLTAGVWGSVAVGENSANFDDEIDIYGSYGWDLSDKVALSLGATLYHYPQYGGVFDIGTDDGDASTFEVSSSLGFATVLSPSISTYYDLTLETFTIEGGLGHSFPFSSKASLDLSGTAGAVLPDAGDDYQYLSLAGSVSYQFTPSTSAYIGVNGGLSSEDTFMDTDPDILDPAKSSSFWFGAGISSGF